MSAPIQVATQVACGSETHWILWRDGRLLVPAHDDPDAERAFAALGGDACTCIEILDAWLAHRADPRLLLLGPRDCHQTHASRDPHTIRQSVTGAPRGPHADDKPDPLMRLLSLEDGIVVQLVAAVFSTLLARQDDSATHRLLEAALYGRVLSSLSRWVLEVPELDLEVIGAGDEPALVSAGEMSFRARLPLEWLLTVWAPGLDVVDGDFTLAAGPEPATVRVSRWEL